MFKITFEVTVTYKNFTYWDWSNDSAIKSTGYFPENPGSIPSTHMVANNCLVMLFPGDLMTFCELCRHQHAHGTQTYVHAKYSLIHNKINEKNCTY